jgi:hypothetical protein
MKDKYLKVSNKIKIGWREWISLPKLGIPSIKAKIDTGARTSSLHAFRIEPISDNGIHKVKFWIHPIQHNKEHEISSVAEIIDKRSVKNSGGLEDERYVIKTPILLGDMSWDIEITLANRDNMKFRILLGRTSLRGKVIIDPNKSFLSGYQYKEHI